MWKDKGQTDRQTDKQTLFPTLRRRLFKKKIIVELKVVATI